DRRRPLAVNFCGQTRDARLRPPALVAGQPPCDDAHDDGDTERKDRDDEKGHPRYLNLNSTETSTMTSTGEARRRAGEKRHWRTACMARSFNPPPSPRIILRSPTEPSRRTTISMTTSPSRCRTRASSV